MFKPVSLLGLLFVPTLLHAEPAPMQVAQAQVMTDGVVRKIDAANGKVTIKHGPIVNLDMPGMTMVFRVVSPTLLNTIKEGDTVKFRVERMNGSFTVTEIQAVK